MEGAFTHLGNHLVSDSAAAINAGEDDLSTLDPDESLLYGKYPGRRPVGSARRRNDDDDNDTEVFEDDDAESMASVPVGAMRDLNIKAPEEDKKLPPHACACVCPSGLYLGSAADSGRQLLWHPLSRLCREVPCLQQVVLQCSWQC
ncbi:hypothetical protein GGR56DRAFT_597770 [Xylariaceae sp. FL0804]|nr:hypothetical protein GGR56DRAFT_597770 [Xylariaceae sp. FL0804]